MIVVADSWPLIIIAKLGYFESLHRLFPSVHISSEVHSEIVTSGAGLHGALEVSQAEWIQVKTIHDPSSLQSARREHNLGAGELTIILLAKELGTNLILLDDYMVRKLAKAGSLKILGSVGLLEIFYSLQYFTDLRAVFQQLLTHNVYIDQRLLNRRLQRFGLPPV